MTCNVLQRNVQACSCNQGCGVKAISITYSEYVLTAVGTRMAHAPILLYVACRPLPDLSTLFLKRHNFRN
jgi:hypothetical protein